MKQFSLSWVLDNLIGKLEDPTQYKNKDYQWIIIGKNRLRSEQYQKLKPYLDQATTALSQLREIKKDI